MELDILHKYALKILTLFLVIAMVLMMTTCQDEIDYSNEDNPYDDDYGSFIGVKYENNDDRLPIKANTVSKKITREALKCDENQLMTYLAELQVTNPESLLLIASYKDLDHLCRFVDELLVIWIQLTYFCRHAHPCLKIIFTCNSLQGSAFLALNFAWSALIRKVRFLSYNMCECSFFQVCYVSHVIHCIFICNKRTILTGYQKYLSCFHELHTEYIDCAGPADWTENMAHNELCNEYKSIADCYYTKSAMLCGIKAAKIMKELVVRVINGIIDVSNACY
ncbi:uncharacterized protein LOC124180921 isoform X3 [Neodiprion fabricii]|uniref:uncharacterized protein LOC124180921 isoform X3 n=1 Tax=Neodiprion fabricii TaxID=2872261 RepID=UPI001ED8F7AB|nr:uncharacterized protein LOC124180921 isoform X3 [Neodiprion fabricii]